MSMWSGWGVVEEGWRKGPWTAQEDRLLIEYVRQHGEGRWNSVSRLAGLKRNGKSCRLRWVNYLRPDLKKGHITPHEETIILDLHAKWGNRWSTIARSLPGRTDNEIKNYWRTHFKKKTKSPTNNAEKTKNRILKKQQFQQQRKIELQQEQQLLQFNELDDMKKIISLLNDDDNDNDNISSSSSCNGNNNNNNNIFYAPHHITHSTTTTTTTTTSSYDQSEAEQQLQRIYNNSGPNNVYFPVNEENGIWEGLWNMDLEGHGSFGVGPCAPRKHCFQNFPISFC